MRLILALLLVLATTTAHAKVDEVQRNPDGSTITFFNNYHSAIISGRKLKPLGPKLNPVWWFKNDAEPTAPAWYDPQRPQPWRNISWYLRNPWQNAGKYVFGLADRNYRVDSTADLRVGGDLVGSGKNGCFRLTISHISGFYPWEKRHFVSCTNRNTLWYAGWQWLGFFGFKWNLLHSNIQAW